MFGRKQEKEENKEEEGGADEKEEKEEIGDTENAKESKDSGDGTVMEMRKGDYMIHIYVEKAKEIQGQEDTSDPLIEITCLNQKQYTTSKDDISRLAEVNWSEHLFLEPKDVSKQDAEDAQIVIKLMDKGFFKDSLIGTFEFNLSFVYLKKDHVMLHQWIALSNPNSEKYWEITGYLKVSISVACTGDEQVQIEEDDGVEGNDNVLMPPQLNPKFYQIKIRIFQAQQLPAMDIGIKYVRKAKTDAYVMTTYKNRKLKTKVVIMEEGGEPINWDQEFWIPAQIPIISSRLVIKLMDEDDFTDEVIGSLLFDVKDILDGKYKDKYVWKNIYGSPLNYPNTQAKKDMNENPELASTWKGRILMQVTCEKCEESNQPLAKVQKIASDIVMTSKLYTRPREYAVIAEIGQGVALPDKKKYTVQITLGGEIFKTKEPKIHSKTNYCRWDERFDEQTIQLPYVSCQDFGTVIITLMDDKNRPVCYYVDNISNFIYNKDEHVKYHWVSLKPDTCVGRVKDPKEAGMISFKLSLHDCELGPPNFKDNQSWKKKPAIRAHSVRIRAYIYQCKDLPAADSNGTSDPYIKVWDMSEGKPKQTQVIEDNTNPLYYEVLEFEYEVRDINDLESYPPFLLDLYDRDEGMLDSDDFLARAIIEPENCSIVQQNVFDGECTEHGNTSCTFCVEERTRLEIPNEPRWHPLRYSEGDPESGQVLVSFAVTSLGYTYTIDAPGVDLRSRVEVQEFDVNMLILGLRQLQSPGILPVKKAFVNFNIKSLVPPNSSAVQNIKTQPKASGNNPTINTTMKFSIPLPVQPLYCPMLSCMVYDYIFKGWNQPLIGVFTVPIGELMESLKEERKRETDIIRNINAELAKILGPEEDMAGSRYSVASYSLNGEEGQAQINLDGSIIEDENENLLGSVASLSGSIGGGNAGLKGKKKKKPGKVSDPKREIQKAMKGTSNQKDVSEQLGANELIGIRQAEDNHEEKLKKLREERSAAQRRNTSQEDGGGGFMMSKGVTQRNSRVGSVNSQSKADMLREHNVKLDQEKRLLEDDRIRAEEELNEKGDKAQEMVIMPQYELDKEYKVEVEVESSKPPAALFMPIGFDEDKDTKRKHYRQYFNDELELVKEIFPTTSPFNTYDLKRGQSRGLKSGGLFSIFKKQKKDDSGQVSTIQCVGKFKGIIEIESQVGKQKYIEEKTQLIKDLQRRLNVISERILGKKLVVDTLSLGDAMERKKFQKKMRSLNLGHLEITKHLANLESDNILKRALLAQTVCLVRIYCLDAYDLSSRDNGSPSDPYLKIMCNGKTFDERDNYQLDEPNPRFYKHFDFEGTFPGCSPLQLDIFDYDTIFGDDLIGTTIVDLEDRYFSMEWNALREKPIEFRQIYHESSSISQGVIKCWVEINPVGLAPEFQPPLWDIREQPPVPMEIRICVFNAVDVEIMDVEGTSDVFFKGFFDSKEDVQETDTHFRNQDGKPDFQYRLIYRIDVPRKKDYKFQLQCYDRDFFKSNDMIGEATLNLKKLIDDSKLVKANLGLNKNFYEKHLKEKGFQKLEFDSKDKSKFWLPMSYKDPISGQISVRGKVMVQVDVLPAELADKNPVGRARQEPNHSPFLPQPEGRFELSLNPLKMYAQLIGPALRRKICAGLCCLVCCALILAILPNIIGALASKSVCDIIKIC